MPVSFTLTAGVKHDVIHRHFHVASLSPKRKANRNRTAPAIISCSHSVTPTLSTSARNSLNGSTDKIERGIHNDCRDPRMVQHDVAEKNQSQAEIREVSVAEVIAE
jgi:hypothetical protein